MRLMSRLVAVALYFCGAIGMSPPASAENLILRVVSESPYIVHLEFYSQNYSRAWPGNDRVYVLDDYDVHTFNLACTYGETICYGAWPAGDSSRYWGVGRGNSSHCQSCCYTCGDRDTRTFQLLP